MSPRVTRARSRAAPLQQKAAGPYLLRSRVALADASNVIGLHRAQPQKRKKAALVKEDKEKEKEKKKAKKQKEEKEKAEISSSSSSAPSADVCAGADPQTHTAGPQSFSCLLLDVPDVDSADAADAQMCSEYVCDIYTYLQQLEVAMPIRPQYLAGQEVSVSMRAEAVDWLMQLRREFCLRHESLFMSVGLIDRFMQDHPVPKRCLQLLCVTAMLLSCKYEEIHPPTVGDFAFVTDGACSGADILRMERILLRRLDFSLGRPIALHFLQRLCKIRRAGVRERGLALFLLDVSLLDEALLHVPPSLMAAAAFTASLQILGHGSVTEDSLTPIVHSLALALEKISLQTQCQEIRSRLASVSSSLGRSPSECAEKLLR